MHEYVYAYIHVPKGVFIDFGPVLEGGGANYHVSHRGTCHPVS